MEFRIANTFTASLARLTGDEQKAVKVTAFEFQMNPVHPGMQLHRIDKTKDPNFWSVRVSRDVRLIAAVVKNVVRRCQNRGDGVRLRASH